MKTLNVVVPKEISSDKFIKFVKYYADKFIRQNGLGRWLAEYNRMQNANLFEPHSLRQQYLDILYNRYRLGFICKQAVCYICLNAIDAVKAAEEIEALTKSNAYEIRLITGETAIDDDGALLTELELNEAKSICNAMNEDAEENLFTVFDLMRNICVT